MKSEFDQLMEDFLKLKTIDKKEIVLNDAKKQLALLMKLNSSLNNSDPSLNRELNDINRKDSTYDDFLEASFVYINLLDDLLSKIIEKIPKN